MKKEFWQGVGCTLAVLIIIATGPAFLAAMMKLPWPQMIGLGALALILAFFIRTGRQQVLIDVIRFLVFAALIVFFFPLFAHLIIPFAILISILDSRYARRNHLS